MRNRKFAAVCILINLALSAHGGEPSPPARFPVIVQGDLLIANDGSGRRFFAAGMVDNEPEYGQQLSKYNHGEMAAIIQKHAELGASALRWNAFLKGSDLRWDSNGLVSGLCDNAIENIVDGLNLAHRNGIVIEVVLSTGHFLQYGWGGKIPKNTTRVDNNQKMFSTEEGIQAYIDHALRPIIQTVGAHPGLLGYLICNEIHAMVHPDDTNMGSWADKHVRLPEMQRWVNRVAGAIHREQPGALVSVAVVPKILSQWTDEQLVSAGGDALGFLDWFQIQFYPDNHKEIWSPFHNEAQEWGRGKPIIAGEFPIRGIHSANGKTPLSKEFSLEGAYEALWKRGYSGGFSWSWNIYKNMNPEDKARVADAYGALREKHKKNLSVEEGVKQTAPDSTR